MLITWLGHACFKIEEQDYSLIVDPYANGSVEGLNDLKESANDVKISHNHFDHSAIDAIEIIKNENCPFSYEYIDTYHDHHNGEKRGANRITIVKCNDQKVVHLGDLGCPLKEDELIKVEHCDVLMIPVGGHFTIGSKEAFDIVKSIKPKAILPMHYKTEYFGFDILEDVDNFAKLFDTYNKFDASSIDSDNTQGLVILKPKYARK